MADQATSDHATGDHGTEKMQCMEVWGGSRLTAQGVEFGGLDAWVYSKPFGDSSHGGDVYYASSCATGRISRLLLADVSGHGDAVAATAKDLRTLMRQFVNRLDQGEFVRMLNTRFSELSDAGTFATAVVTTFFAPSRRLTVCNAGHPRPLLYRGTERQWGFLSHGQMPDAARKSGTAPRGPRNLPLGMIAISQYEQFDVELDPGDCLITYSDALIESNDRDGEMLGEAGLLKIARGIEAPGITEEPRYFAERLLGAIAALQPDNLTDDDVTILMIRANGKQPDYPLSEKAAAFGRLAVAVIRSLSSKAERAPLPDATLPNMGGAIIPFLARRWRAPR